jgi:hypothetical protein
METWQRAGLKAAGRHRGVLLVCGLLVGGLNAMLVAAPLPDGVSSFQPYPIDWSLAHRTEIDLSRFLDAPAGREGFLRAQGGRIVRPDGRRFRFWGVNLCGADCFPSATEAEQLAGDLARMGINLVRFHHLDSEWGRSIFEPESDNTRQLSAESLERLDYLLAQLKRRGIYANLNLNVLRKYRAGDGVRDWQALGIGKGATFFNPRLIELQQEYACQLLTHRNPHTGLEYRHDPAIAVVEVVNENSLLEAWVNGRLIGQDHERPGIWSPIPISYADELTDLFNEWLAQGLPVRELDRLRTETQAGPGGAVPRLTPAEFGAASRERFQTEARFYLELERRFFERMHHLLRDELGLKALLVGTADHNHHFSGLAHLSAQLQFDVVDGHGYWQHPRLENETWTRNTPMVNDPLDSTVVRLARTPMVARPYTLSEVNHPFPHEYAAEGFPILTAYSMFHDWDGIVGFTWGPGRRTPAADGIRPNGWFDLSNNPVKLATLQACALMWHRQDVAPARRSVTRFYSPERLLENLRADPAKAPPFFIEGFPKSTPLQHATRFRFGEKAVGRLPGAAPLDRIVSDTGELGWYHADRGRGVVTVDTARSQALIGFVKRGELSTRNLDAELETDFCALLLTSLDDRPLNRSSRLLLIAVARLSNTGFGWKPDHQTVDQWGHGPVLVEPVIGTITLRDLGRAYGVRARPLAANGTLLPGTVEACAEGDAWSFAVGEPTALWYRIDVQRTRTPDRR